MSEYLHRYQMLVKKFSLSSNCRIGDPFSVFPILFVKLPFQNYSLEDKTLGQYRYALDSTGMFWAVPVCSGQYQFVFGTGMLWAVPVCSRQYRYDLGSIGMIKILQFLHYKMLQIFSFTHNVSKNMHWLLCYYFFQKLSTI